MKAVCCIALLFVAGCMPATYGQTTGYRPTVYRDAPPDLGACARYPYSPHRADQLCNRQNPAYY